MPRNRQLMRLVHVSRRSKKYPAQADPPQPRRRAFRRFAVPAAAAALLLIVTQVVLAAPPIADFDFDGSNPVTPKVPDVGESVSFSATVTDPDVGDTHTFAWDFGDGGTGTGQNPSHTYSSPGEKSVTLTVTDAPGGETSIPVTKTLRVNAPPNAAFHFEPTQPLPNQQILFTSDSTDAEGAVSLAWDLDNDGAFDDGSDVTESWSFATGGEKTVRLQVTDSDGSVRTSSRTVPVFLNSPPSASFNFSGTNPVTPAVPDVDEDINFTSTSTDPDGNETIVDWDWDFDNDGQFDDGSGATFTHPGFATSGNKTVGLRVTDSSGQTNSTTRTDVRVNALPVARPSSLNPQAEPGQKYNVPLINQPIQFTGGSVPALPGASPAPGCPASGGSPASQGSTDAEGAIARYEWDLDGDGSFETDRGTDPTAPHPGFPAAGDRTAALRVTDSDLATATTTLQFRVNTAPTAAFVFEPFTPIIGQEVTFGSTSSDPDAADSGKHIYSWDLDNDGTFCEAGETGASVRHTFQTANTNPGHRVTLRVTDDGGITRGIPRDVPVQITVPTGSISFSPDAPLPGQAVTFTGSASSPTGKAIASMEWDFSFDPSTGQFDVEASGGSVSHAFPTPGLKTVALRIQEAGGGFAVRTTEQRLVVNAPPRAGFTVSPEEAFLGDGVTLSSTSADPDGPLTRQDWDLDNDGQFDDANAAVVSANFTRAGTYPLALRVTDSRGATSTSTGQVVIRTRPVAPPPPTPLLSGVLIELQGQLSGKFTRVRRLLVRAPKDSKIIVRCLGKRCPKRVTKMSKGSKKLRFKKLERRFLPKTKLIVSVTKDGFIGKRTSWTMRRRKAPLRRDLCLMPGAKTATSCPAG